MKHSKDYKHTPEQEFIDEKKYELPKKEEVEVISDEQRAYLDFKRALERENAERFRCPSCKTWMRVTATGKYLHHGGAQSDYSKWECDSCGYVLHSYLPLPAGIRDSLPELPF